MRLAIRRMPARFAGVRKTVAEKHAAEDQPGEAHAGIREEGAARNALALFMRVVHRMVTKSLWLRRTRIRFSCGFMPSAAGLEILFTTGATVPSERTCACERPRKSRHKRSSSFAGLRARMRLKACSM